MPTLLRALTLAVIVLAIVGCGDGDSAQPRVSPTPTETCEPFDTPSTDTFKACPVTPGMTMIICGKTFHILALACTRTPTPTPTPTPSANPTNSRTPTSTVTHTPSQACDPVAATFDACLGASTESECTAACGQWHRGGLSPDPICNCPTGQRGQRCTRQSDCLGACIAPLNDDCSGVEEGTCTSMAPYFGCACWFSDLYPPHGLCAD